MRVVIVRSCWTDLFEWLNFLVWGFGSSQTNSFKKKAGLTVCLHVPLQWLCLKVFRQSDNIHPQKAAELATSNQNFSEFCQMCYSGGGAVMEGGQRVATTVWFKRCCCFILHVTGQTVLKNKSGHAKDRADEKHWPDNSLQPYQFCLCTLHTPSSYSRVSPGYPFLPPLPQKNSSCLQPHQFWLPPVPTPQTEKCLQPHQIWLSRNSSNCDYRLCVIMVNRK